MHEKEIIEAEFEEVDENVQETSKSVGKLSKREIVKALKTAIDDGVIDVKQGKNMREQMGIFNRNFTKKKILRNKRKDKRNIQKMSRRNQRRR